MSTGKCSSECVNRVEKNSNQYVFFISLKFIFFFKMRLYLPLQKLSVQQELLSPVLTALVKCSRCNSLQRRYLRQQVLPPLRDVKTRPEVGDQLRNRLVKLLTTPATQVRDLVADFLFVLCKENGNYFFGIYFHCALFPMNIF